MQERFLNEINFQQMSNQQQTVNNYNNCTFNFTLTKCQYYSVILHIHMPVLYFTLSVKYVNLKTEFSGERILLFSLTVLVFLRTLIGK